MDNGCRRKFSTYVRAMSDERLVTGLLVFTPDFLVGFVLLDLYFSRSLFVLLSIALSVLRRCSACDYPFGIFKLFLLRIDTCIKQENI